MKRNLLFVIILCGGLSFAQTTGKVGIETNSPTETLDVKGTVRVQTLPQDGVGTVSTPSTGTNFKATKTVVVDDNGVLGVVEGTPVTELPPAPNIPKVRTIQYVAKTVPIDENTPTASIIQLGNLKVRYNITSASQGTNQQSLSFMLLNTSLDNVICNVNKTGSGGNATGGQTRIFSAQKDKWYNIGPDNAVSPNIRNNDFALVNIALLNTKEVYRLTVSANSPIEEKGKVNTNANNNELGFVESPAQITLFLERLTNHEE